MRPPSTTEQQRSEARRRYEAGEPLRTISKSMGIHNTTLFRLKEAEGWFVNVIVNENHRDFEVHKSIRAQVIDISTKKAVELMAESGVAEQQADLIAESLGLHGKVSAFMLGSALTMMQRFEAGQIQPAHNQNLCDVFNALITGVTKAVAASRDIGGLKPGDISSIQKQVQDKAISINIQPYEPIPLQLDADGRATDAA